MKVNMKQIIFAIALLITTNVFAQKGIIKHSETSTYKKVVKSVETKNDSISSCHIDSIHVVHTNKYHSFMTSHRVSVGVGTYIMMYRNNNGIGSGFNKLFGIRVSVDKELIEKKKFHMNININSNICFSNNKDNINLISYNELNCGLKLIYRSAFAQPSLNVTTFKGKSLFLPTIEIGYNMGFMIVYTNINFIPHNNYVGTVENRQVYNVSKQQIFFLKIGATIKF